MRMPIQIAAASALLPVLLGGCGGNGDSTPVACLEGSSAYAQALDDAPTAVKLAGGVPISDCLAENQKGGDLASVGAAMVAAATRLNAGARAKPGGAAALRLGYLIGAAQRGAERTEGIHTDLVRRLTVAARYAPPGKPLPATFYRVYRAGYAAGHRNG